MTSSDQAEWFRHQLDSSDSAKVKRQYLLWYAVERGIAFAKQDPLFVSEIQERTSFAWTLAEVLWRARLISLDDRTLWECLGPQMVTERVRRFIDPWNEQLAVKVAYCFLQSQAPTESGNRDDNWKNLRIELDAYATETIKPQGASTVDDYIPLTTSARENHTDGNKIERKAITDSITTAWSDKVAFIPMEANNSFSEGSLRCIAPVSSSGVLLQVPRTEMFFHDIIVEHCALGRVIAASPALCELLSNEEAMLVMCLVYERFVVGPNKSHWRQLLTNCPSHYPTFPATWTLSDLSELEGLDILDDVLAKRKQLQTVAEQLESSLVPIFHELLSANEIPTGKVDATVVPSEEELRSAFCWDNLAWAQSTFDSRAFNLNIDGTVVLALVPLADMINHTNRTDVLVRKVEPNGGPFTMQVGAALTGIDVGRELWMSYGPLQNWELLQHYGFVLGCENEHDKLPFPLTLPDASGFNNEEEEEGKGMERRVCEGDWDARRRALLHRYALCLPGRCWVGHDGVPPPALLAMLRVQLAQASEFAVMEQDLYGPFATLSAQTEAAVVAAVQTTVQCVLNVFPTTLADDEETLAALREPVPQAKEDVKNEDEDEEDEGDAESIHNYTLCVQLRIGLKRIASRTLEWCSHRM